MISAIITCAGNGTRFGSDKLFAKIKNKTIFIYTLENFVKAKKIDEIIVSVRQDNLKKFQKLAKEANIKVKFVIGGSQRFISALNGLAAAQGEFVVIHDGARPIVSPDLIDQVVTEVKKHNAVMTAIPPHVSIKYSTDGFISDHPPRSLTWMAQTPQAYRKDIIKKAYEMAITNNQHEGCDDSELVGHIGIPVKIIPGEFNNLKITLPQDLDFVACLLKNPISKYA